jgi:plastocyanin
MRRPYIETVMRGSALAVVLVLLGAASMGGVALAQEFKLVIRNHKFEPTEIRVPAGKRVSIEVSNEDATPEEFESRALKVEKVIPGKSKGLVRIGPLAPGRYEFIGDFHADTAKGVVIAE